MLANIKNYRPEKIDFVLSDSVLNFPKWRIPEMLKNPKKMKISNEIPTS